MSNKIIVISPFSKKLLNDKNNPKNYPYFNEIILGLKYQNFDIIQLGITGEYIFNNVEPYFDISFSEIIQIINNSFVWISVDNFLPHLLTVYHCKPGIVVWGQSDPNIFGYDHNINLLKDRKYLRAKQFWMWEQCEYREEVFVPAIEVLSVISNQIS